MSSLHIEGLLALLNDLDLKEAEASPGIWKVRDSPRGDDFFVEAPGLPGHAYGIEVLGDDKNQAEYPTARGDAEFIAAVRNNYKQLAASLRQLYVDQL